MAKGDYEALGSYFSGPLQNPSSNSVDIAKFILRNASPAKADVAKDSSNDPSLMGRIFDILSRPNYAVAEYTRNAVETGNLDLSSFLEGLTGEKKTTFSKVLDQAGVPESSTRSLLGLAMDIGLDPTTYVPIAGPLSRIARTAKGGKETADILEKPLAQQILDKGDAIFPESFGLPAKESQFIPDILKGKKSENISSGKPVQFEMPGKVDLPDQQLELFPPELLAKSALDAEKAEQAAKAAGLLKPASMEKIANPAKGQKAFSYPNLNVGAARAKAVEDLERLKTADNYVSNIAAGDIADALRMVPLPPPVVSARHAEFADDILSKTSIDDSVEISAKQQVALYRKAQQTAQALGRSQKRSQAWINDTTIKIYSSVEKQLTEQLGKTLRISTGESVKLSDVIADFTMRGKSVNEGVLREFSSTFKPGSDVWKSVQILKARGAVEDAPKVKQVLDSIIESKAVTKESNLLSDAQLFDYDKFLKKFGKASTDASGASKAASEATQKLIDVTLKSSKSRAQIGIELMNKELDDIIATGKANPKVTATLTHNLEKDLGRLPQWVANDNKAVEWLMARVATWWGQETLRPLSLNMIGSAHATAATRGKVLDNMFASFDLPTRQESWRLAQGQGKATSVEAEQLATQIKRIMDNLVGQVSGQSVLLRSGVHMDMLNKWMRHYGTKFEFSNKLEKDFLGNPVDFSKGTDWVNSWKIADAGDDPKLFLFKIQEAMEMATREKALFDEMGERFGSQFAGKGYTNKLTGYPYIEGYYFPEDIAKQIPRVIKDWTPGSPNYNKVIGLYDRVLSMWKSGVTIYRPGHHVRNAAGDIYLGWMDGVNSVRPYMLAAKVQRSMRGAYQDIMDVDRLVELGALSKGFKAPNPNEIIFRNRSGIPFTAEQIAAVAHQKGLLEHARTIEDIIDLGDSGRKSILDVKPFGGKVQKIARGASELQSHNARLAHFIDKVMKSRGDNFQDIFEQASRRARKWHPTGLDLTDFEKKVLRRTIPFYSWMRKSFPLLLEGLVMNPGKVLVPSKAYGSIQEMQGIETPGRQDPFPVDQMFPEWIRSQGLGPVGKADGLLGSLSNQSPAGYVMGGVGLNPLADLMSQISNPGQTVVTGLTPAFQIPYQLATGRKTFTGEPISGPDARPGATEQFIGEQIPLWSMLQGITGITPFGGETKKSQRSDTASREALTNFLTGLGVRGTGPYVNQARYEKTQPKRVAQRAQKDQYLSDLRDN